MSFWQELKRPFFVLAPMADVTDAAFRRIIAKYSKYGGINLGDYSEASLPAKAERVGGPDVTWTEFVSADGLAFADEEGKAKLMKDLIFTEEERPIVAQFFTSRPETMAQAARLAEELGFDGVDINMGCPDRSIEKQGAGAAHMKDPQHALEVIKAAQGATSLPVSVKTRLGYNKDELEEWLPTLLSVKLAAVTIHARTRKEMSKVPARWDRIARAVEIRDELGSNALILGNGDATDLKDAKQKAAETGCDGVMLGRAIFGNPWCFNETIDRDIDVSINDRLETMVEHTKLFDELLGDTKNFAVMKKHYKAYVSGFDGAAELRAKLMETHSANEVEQIVKLWINQVGNDSIRE